LWGGTPWPRSLQGDRQGQQQTQATASRPAFGIGGSKGVLEAPKSVMAAISANAANLVQQSVFQTGKNTTSLVAAAHPLSHFEAGQSCPAQHLPWPGVMGVVTRDRLLVESAPQGLLRPLGRHLLGLAGVSTTAAAALLSCLTILCAHGLVLGGGGRFRGWLHLALLQVLLCRGGSRAAAASGMPCRDWFVTAVTAACRVCRACRLQTGKNPDEPRCCCCKYECTQQCHQCTMHSHHGTQ
jgi:hypothetical protein